jgi:hypothetical protein
MRHLPGQVRLKGGGESESTATADPGPSFIEIALKTRRFEKTDRNPRAFYLQSVILSILDDRT